MKYVLPVAVITHYELSWAENGQTCTQMHRAIGYGYSSSVVQPSSAVQMRFL